jgi:hypothetical protein
MTHGSSAEHGAGQTFFPAAEWQQFQTDDRKAGTILILLMGGIFTTGLILYSIVLLLVWSKY